ncbi:MAG: hypothetical protein ABIR92_04975 [Gemmatimonadaceae bacterium]
MIPPVQRSRPRQALAQGRVPDNYDYPGLIGFSENHSNIFTQNLSSPLSTGWYGRFNGPTRRG